MKKVALYSLGGLILVGLAGFWVYSFLYGSPTNNAPVFANFDFFGGEAPAAEPLPVFVPTEPVVDTNSAALRQLTTKPVIGMRIITVDGDETMRYVEAGTGHIFDINLETGVEERISNVSVPQAFAAKISESGQLAAIQTLGSEFVMINVTDTNSVKKVALQSNAKDFWFTQDNLLSVAYESNGVVETQVFSVSGQRVATPYTVPFTAVDFYPDPYATSTLYFANKPAVGLLGYIYTSYASNIKRVYMGTGLMLSVGKTKLVVSELKDNKISAFTLDKETLEKQELPITILASKCASYANNFYCGSGINQNETINLTDWLQFEFAFADKLWRISSEGVLTQLIDPLIITGRQIDMVNLNVSENGEMVYFINRIDRSLWLYEISN